MPWARFDDRFPSNRKIRMLGDGAFRLYVSAVCWSAENLTDGFIPHDELLLVSDTRDAEGACEELVKRKLWTAVAGGWQIHDYHEYNPTADQVRAERKAKTARQERWRENKRRAAAGLPPLNVDASRDAFADADGDANFSRPWEFEANNPTVDASTGASTDASTEPTLATVQKISAGNGLVDASVDASQDAAPRARVPAPPRPVPPMSSTNPGAQPEAIFDLPEDSVPDSADADKPRGDTKTPKPSKHEKADELAAAFWDIHKTRMAQPFIAIRGIIRTALSNGLERDDVARALDLLAREGTAISGGTLQTTLKQIKVARDQATGTNVIQLPAQRPSTTDQRVAQAKAAGQRFAAAFRAAQQANTQGAV